MPAKKKIFFQISSINLTNYYFHPFKEFNKNQPVEIKIGIGYGIDKNAGMISVKFSASFKQNDNNFLGIETIHNFKLKDKSDLNECTDKELNLPHNFLKSILSIAISGTRGYLSSINSVSPYCNIYLPLLDPQKLIPRKIEKSKTK